MNKTKINNTETSKTEMNNMEINNQTINKPKIIYKVKEMKCVPHNANLLKTLLYTNTKE